MCLYYTTTDPQKLFGDRKSITCYKIVDKSRVEDTFYTPFQGFEFPKRGIFRSNRESKNLDSTELYSRAIHYGIHVFTKKRKKGFSYAFEGSYCVPVICLREDFVAYNKDNNEAVFMKVRIHKRAKFTLIKG